MCLTINHDETANAKKEENRTVTRWKVLRYTGQTKGWRSIHFLDYFWVIGENIAVRCPDDHPDLQKSGIHVYKCYLDAAFDIRCHEYVVAVQCELKDLIAIGTHVFTQDQQEVYSKVTVKEFPQTWE